MFDQVPSPPELEDLYDGLSDESPQEAVAAWRRGWWVAGVISLALSVYGFWVGFAALRAWFSPGPFCGPECRRGILYALLLLAPACFGVILGLALIKGRSWAPPVALAVFGAFALENFVRIDLEFAFTYRLLFFVMFVANLAGIGALIWGGQRWNPLQPSEDGLGAGASAPGADDFAAGELTVEPGTERSGGHGVTLASGRVVHPDQLGLSVQETSLGVTRTAAHPGSVPPCRIAAATLLVLAIAWYRIPDSLLRKDFLGVFSFERPPVPHWIAASPAVSALVLYGFALAVAILMAKRWTQITTAVTGAIIVGMCLAYLPSAPTPWLRAECIGLAAVNGLLVGTLLAPKCRLAPHE